MHKKKKWYVVQAVSGCEQRIVTLLQENIKNKKMEDKFGKILIPAEKVTEMKHGKKKNSECKFFPGYILINMIMNDFNWHLVKNIPKVLGFIGGTSDRPCAVSKKEINLIIKKLKKIGNKTRPKTIFQKGEKVRVNNGPFIDFNGTVEEVDYDKNRLKVSISIFGRSTPVELNFAQVEKN
ncbi:transcription termination/antitermination protein NusG [Buchnera aphidicola (Mollitrichosiphum nigrofasciatum)]|uniref:transcription termination/antitermination protein NusG n=1 Tax=Buchnera aphidicola TaxID=9 RepID=UPI0031B80F20